MSSTGVRSRTFSIGALDESNCGGSKSVARFGILGLYKLGYCSAILFLAGHSISFDGFQAVEKGRKLGFFEDVFTRCLRV